MIMQTALSNATLVSSAIDAYNRRDVEALCGVTTEDVEVRPPVFALSGRSYLGHEGIAEWLRDVVDTSASARIKTLELRDLGDRVLALTEFYVDGPGGGAPLGSELGLVCHVRDGRLSTWQGFFSHANAIAEAAARGGNG